MSAKKVMFAVTICAGVLIALSMAPAKSGLAANAKAAVLTSNNETDLMSGCSNTTVYGQYGFQRNGQTSQGALTAIGSVVFDGLGHFVDQQTISRNGTFTVITNQTGTYQVNPDCTGTEFDPTGAVFATFVVVHNGSRILGMSMTAGNNVAIQYDRVIDPPQ